jgi:predicted TIM-barrel fold metal-dependent hydrolase
MSSTSAAAIRARVGHPIIDADGHFVELAPILHDEIMATLEEIGGRDLQDRYLKGPVKPTDTSSILKRRTPAGARDTWSAMPSWWGWPTDNVRDRATAHLPALLYERLDEIGLDFTVLYPSMSLAFFEVEDPELAAALCRGVNRHHARMFADYRDRMAVGALIPMHTPEIAVAELQYATQELGLKAAMFSAYVRRPIPALERAHGKLSPRVFRLDHYGLDSEYDYDPFWQACIDTGVAPIAHSSVQYLDVSRSVSNYVYNHIDGISKCHQSLAKSLFLGGVTDRFPSLRIGFLEGGVAWACSLYAGLLGHWEKRNAEEIGSLDPERLDVDRLMAYVDSHGDAETRAASDRLRGYFSARPGRPPELDEFAKVNASKATDIRDKFVPNFYFGCEADDPLAAWAFNDRVNPHGARMRVLFGSDISHWDVPDMAHPVAEAWELVEHGTITEADFRDFVFTNPVRMHAGMNPKFFEGTVCEKAVADAIAEGALS